MADGATLGERLAALRARAGMSMDDVARAGGWKGRSSVQRYFSPDYDAEFLPMDVARSFVAAFEGKGDPPITVQELFTLAGVSLANVGGVFPAREAIGSLSQLPQDVPVYGTALAGEAIFDSVEGLRSPVEQVELDQSEVLAYLKRPPSLAGRPSIYGVYIAGASMFPRFSEGEAVFVDPKRPAKIGDDVIIHIRRPDEHDGERVNLVLIKRLVRRTASYCELEQFNPAVTFRIESAHIKSIHRIVPISELLS